jgi:hypothetical protein
MRITGILSDILCSLKPEWEHMKRTDGSIVVELDACLYGCIESAQQWYFMLEDELKSMGFIQNPYDKCVFKRGECIIGFHVDDLLVTAPTKAEVDKFFEQIVKKFPRMAVHRGTKHKYLGMIFDFNRETKKVSIDCNQFVTKMLDAYPYSGRAATPATEDLFKEGDGHLLGEQQAKEFHSAVAKLLYLSKRVRSDILTPVSYLTSRVKAPTTVDQEKLERVIRFVRNTAEQNLTLGATDGPIGLKAWLDASFAVHPDGSSHSGRCTSLGHGMFGCGSTKQKGTVKSACEAEVRSLSTGGSQLIWMKHFLEALFDKEKIGPVQIAEDNTSAISLLCNERVVSDKSRHMKISEFWLRDKVKEGEVIISHCPTEKMHADALTKPLQGKLFTLHAAALQGSISPLEWRGVSGKSGFPSR